GHGPGEAHEQGPGGRHEHGSGGRHGPLAWLRHTVTPHSHDPVSRTDAALETSRRGMRTLAISFGVLAVTAGVQALIVALSGSVALLGDTLHNLADALTAVPLAIAFSVGRRAAPPPVTPRARPGGDPAVRLRVRPGRGPGRHRGGRGDRRVLGGGRVRGGAPAGPPAGRAPALAGGRGGAGRVRRQRDRGPVPDHGGPADRLGRAG